MIRKIALIGLVVGLLAGLTMVSRIALAAPGDLLGTVNLPGNGTCNVAGTFDGTYYMAVQGDGCVGTTIGVYQPPAGGNGNATLVATKSVVDGGGNPVNISALSWDAGRGRVWAAYDDVVWLIDVGDPTVGGNALATFQFNCGVGGIHLVDGLAHDAGDDTLYYSPDVDLNVYQFSLGTGGNPPLGTLMNTVAPKPQPTPGVTPTPDGRVSGVAIGAGNSLYIGRNGAAEIRRVDKTTGDFVSTFATTSGRVEDLVCDPVTYAPLEAILANDAYMALYEAFEVETGTCPMAGEEPPPRTVGGITDFFVDSADSSAGSALSFGGYIAIALAAAIVVVGGWHMRRRWAAK